MCKSIKRMRERRRPINSHWDAESSTPPVSSRPINSRLDDTSCARAAAAWLDVQGRVREGRDVSDSPLEISGKDIADVVVTFTDHPTELNGTARDSKGVDPTVTVLVFPQQTALWTDHGPTPRRFRPARVASDGMYRLANLPADDYLVIALSSTVPPDWQDPKFLQKIAPLATHVTLADGEKKSQDVETRQVR